MGDTEISPFRIMTAKLVIIFEALRATQVFLHCQVLFLRMAVALNPKSVIRFSLSFVFVSSRLQRSC